MRKFNPETGEFEEVDVRQFVDSLRERGATIQVSDNPCEVFREGGDLDQMLAAEKRKRESEEEAA